MGKSKKKVPAEQQLKDRLWVMVTSLDWSTDGLSDLDYHENWDAWENDMASFATKPLKVDGFEASLGDLKKIEEEVESSCLSDKCKDTLLKSLKKAKK